MTFIATCPQCDTKFSLPLEMLQPEGKIVRCSKCGHKWFQTPGVVEEEDAPVEEIVEEGPEEEGISEEVQEEEPEVEEEPVEEEAAEEPEETPEEGAEEAEPAAEESEEEQEDVPEMAEGEEPQEESAEEQGEDIEDIPEAVKPVEGDEAVAIEKTEKTGPLSKNSLIGYGAAAGVVLLVIVITIFLRPVFVNGSLKANAYYGLFGFSPKIEGKTIAFNGVKATIKDGEVTVEGNLLNLREKEAKVPFMLLNQMDKKNKVVSSMMIEPPVQTLGSNAAQSFNVVVPADEKAVSVKVSLTLKKPKDD